MPLAQILFTASLDPKIDSVALVKSLAVLCLHADPESGLVGPDEDGRPLYDPRTVAETIGAGMSNTFKAFKVLDDLRYIEWKRTWRSGPHERPGSVRVILPTHTAA